MGELLFGLSKTELPPYYIIIEEKNEESLFLKLYVRLADWYLYISRSKDAVWLDNISQDGGRHYVLTVKGTDVLEFGWIIPREFTDELREKFCSFDDEHIKVGGL